MDGRTRVLDYCPFLDVRIIIFILFFWFINPDFSHCYLFSSTSVCRWYEELKKQYELEKESMVENAISLKKEIENITNVQSELKLEKEDLAAKIKNFEKYQK